MRPSSFAVALSSLLLSGPAAAGVLQEVAPRDGDLGTVWSTDSAEALKSYIAPAFKVVTDTEAPRGPKNGFLLAKAGKVYVEVDAAAGQILAVTVNGKGVVIASQVLVDMKKAAPEAFATGKGFHLMVKAKKGRDISSSEALTGDTDASRIFLIDITTYASDGKTVSIVDEAALAFDAETLAPRVGAKRDNTFWYAAFTSYWSSR